MLVAQPPLVWLACTCLWHSLPWLLIPSEGLDADSTTLGLKRKGKIEPANSQSWVKCHDHLATSPLCFPWCLLGGWGGGGTAQKLRSPFSWFWITQAFSKCLASIPLDLMWPSYIKVWMLSLVSLPSKKSKTGFISHLLCILWRPLCLVAMLNTSSWASLFFDVTAGTSAA